MRAASTVRLAAATVLVGFLATTIAQLSAADNWPTFRGPNAGLVPDNPALPEEWAPDRNVAWKIDVPGFAWSSPVSWGDTIFVTTVTSAEPRPAPDLDPKSVANPHTGGEGKQKARASEYRWVLYAVDFKTGRVKWERELKRGLPADPKHSKNSWGSETPVTDGERVYVFHSQAGLFAIDMNGTLVWSRDFVMPKPTGAPTTVGSPIIGGSATKALAADYSIGLGQAASPALYRDRIFVTTDHDSHLWLLAAFDTRTGKELWRHVEPKKSEAYGWSSPFVWNNGRRVEVVVSGNNQVRAFSPEGKVLWELKGLSVSTTPTPFAAHGLLYASSGYPSDPHRPVYAIRPGAHGDITLKDDQATNDYVAWSQRAAASYMPSALVVGDHYYTLYSQGFLTCHDARSGQQVYGRQRLATGAGAFTASPWSYNGKIFAASEDGDTYVVQAGPEFKLLAKNSLGQMVLATPAVVGDSLIIRTVSSLWRITKTGK